MSYCGQEGCYISELHTHQAGTDGIIGQVCKHGALARSCYVCQLEAERDRLLEKLKHGAEANHQAWNRIREQEIKIDRLKVADKQIKQDRDAWKAKVEKLAEALKSVMKLTHGYISTTFDAKVWNKPKPRWRR